MNNEQELLKSQKSPFVLINCEKQVLNWYPGAAVNKAVAKPILTQYQVSTSAKGVGGLEGSHQTPSGWHEVAEKFGKDCAPNSVFASREPTGAIYNVNLQEKFPEKKDWILSRILRLKGLEQGINQGTVNTPDGEKSCDTYERYIYLHGTNREELIGQPASIGCVRMRNNEIIDLFNDVPVGCKVLILENSSKESVDAALTRKSKLNLK